MFSLFSPVDDINITQRKKSVGQKDYLHDIYDLFIKWPNDWVSVVLI